MPEDTILNEGLFCEIHQQNAKWPCGFCGRPVCHDCHPVGLNYQVFHPQCAPHARQQMDQQEQNEKEVEAPSPGVKFFSWLIIIGAMVLFGLGLFLFIFSLLGQQVPLRAMLSSPVPLSIDSIPGGRTILTWLGALGLIFSGLGAVLGVGLLNCAAAARKILLVLAWLDVVMSGLIWLGIAIVGHGVWTIPVVAGVIIWFFNRPRVKKQFEQVL